MLGLGQSQSNVAEWQVASSKWQQFVAAASRLRVEEYTQLCNL